MRLDVISIFPEMFAAIEQYGIPGRCIQGGRISLNVENPRQFAETEYGQIDDRPFGGGPGMVMQAEPLARAVEKIKVSGNEGPVIYLSPQGAPLTQKRAGELAKKKALVLVCGRYEGVDERFVEEHVDEEVSIGDYVLSGGEIAAMVLIDAISRLIPEALGNADSIIEDSFFSGVLDHPHFTRPATWRERAIPEVLASGNHEEIRRWRMRQALERTLRRRPDLIENNELNSEQRQILDALNDTLKRE